MPSLGKNRGRDAGRSRNTTPMSTASTEHGSAMRLATPVATSWNDLLDIPKHGVTPHSSTLKGMLESVKNFSAVAADRVEMHDKGMRECAKLKKEEQERQHEFLVNAAEEEEKRLAALARKELEDRPPQLAVGTHSVAPQDGTSTKACTSRFDSAWILAKLLVRNMGLLDDQYEQERLQKAQFKAGIYPSTPLRQARHRSSLVASSAEPAPKRGKSSKPQRSISTRRSKPRQVPSVRQPRRASGLAAGKWSKGLGGPRKTTTSSARKTTIVLDRETSFSAVSDDSCASGYETVASDQLSEVLVTDEEDGRDDEKHASGSYSRSRRFPRGAETVQNHPEINDVNMQDGTSETGEKSAQATNGLRSTASSPDPVPPRPPPAIPRFQTFGPDPSTFDDPTIYHIRDYDESTPEQLKKEILGVTAYPQHDLRDLTCGTPPDRDLHNAKPASQTTWNVFSTWLEPYFRLITEEDINWLKERGDRSGPMVIPPRGPRSYKEIWAEEDNNGFGDPTASTYQPNGTADGTTTDSTTADGSSDSNSGPGPVLSRLMQLLRPERRAPAVDTSVGAGEATNGDSMMEGMDVEDSMLDVPSAWAPPAQPAEELPVATLLPDFPNVRPPNIRPSWQEMDERVLQELRYIGFLPPDEKPDYASHQDDEIAARIRFLQGELQRVSVVNGARKAKVLEMVSDEMARQEWTGIRDDLDSQLNSAYGKRHRNTGKAKSKLKRIGAAAAYTGNAAGGAGTNKIGEPIKLLMERRNQWIGYLGPAVDFGKREVPAESIFKADDPGMMALLAQEKESWEVPEGN